VLIDSYTVLVTGSTRLLDRTSSALAALFIRLETHRKFSKKLIKITVPYKEFSQMRHGLNILSVNHSTIFPDIDGLCARLQWRYSHYDDEQ